LESDKKQTFIILDISRINDAFTSTSFSLGKALAEKGHTVLHLNNPLTIKDILGKFKKSDLRHFERRTKAENPNFSSIYLFPVLPINWLPRGWIYRLFAALNTFIFNLLLQIKLSGKTIESPVFINSFNPFYKIWPAVSGINPEINIYQSVDLMRKSRYIKKHGSMAEKRYAAAADIVLLTAESLRDEFENMDNVHILPNAVDYRNFESGRQASLPRDWPSEATGKIIGYFGHIDASRLDTDLLKASAAAYPKHSFILIGKVSLPSEVYKPLASLSNVYFLEPVPYNELGACLAHFDCCIIPFRMNELTRYIYPLKINEYLSLGKPVVTTYFSSALDQFNNLVYLEKKSEGFINALALALQEDDKDRNLQRQKKAAQESWDNRAEKLITILEEYRDYGKN